MLTTINFQADRKKGVVGLGGLEPPTSRLSGVRSDQLSYRPILNRIVGFMLRRCIESCPQRILHTLSGANSLLLA